jgi:DNA-binding NarL/FixJ family response regulator
MSDPAPAPSTTANPASSPRLVVVDADERTRESICGILGIRHRYDVVGSAGHAGAAIALVAEHHPDILIIDPRLPDLPEGIALIRRIRSIEPGICILAVGWTPALEHDTIAAGADGFVRKTFKPGDLSGAIERCIGTRDTLAETPDVPPAPRGSLIL